MPNILTAHRQIQFCNFGPLHTNLLPVGQRQRWPSSRPFKCRASTTASAATDTDRHTADGTPKGAVDGWRIRDGIRPEQEHLHPATEDVPMDFYDASSLEDPVERRRALDDLLVPLGHAPGSEVEEIPLHGMRKNDYTPFEYLSFLDEEIVHHINVQVDAPVSKVYSIWEERLNWTEWFDLISQTVFHKEDPNIVSLFMFYRWGQLPTLELYVTLKREQAEKDSFIIEKTAEGFPMAAAVFFREKDGGTEVNLRIAYALCAQLKEFVGPVGVYGSVNDILNENMVVMKEFIESVDLDDVKQARDEDNKNMDEFVAEREKEIAEAYREYYSALEQYDDASIELDEMKRKAAEEAEQTASETTEPNATATSPVTAAEQNPDAQNMSEFSPAEAAGSRGYEGGGQDAESATARFATPSGARGTDFWASNSEQSSQPGTSAGTSAGLTPKETQPGDPGAGQESDASSADDAKPSGPIKPNKTSLFPPEQPKQKGRTPQTQPNQPQERASEEDITRQDPGGGDESGGNAAETSTPSGPVGSSAARARPKASRRAKAGAENGEQSQAAPKRRTRRAKAQTEE